MKVLWITNTLFPDVCKELGINIPVVGGWMYAGAQNLCSANKNIDLGVATLYDGDSYESFSINEITYFLIPSDNKKKYQTSLEGYWKRVNERFSPDLTHIHGTEYPHGLAYIKACGNKNVVVSIQGLVSIYKRYFLAGISPTKLRKNTTIRDYIRQDTIFSQRNDMRRRAEYEKNLIQSVNHIIGRTSWDKSHIWAINPETNYHFCNETLRNEFYQYNWEIKNTEKHSIFLSQGHYPIKGAHQMIKALPTILNRYPDTKVYIAGNDFVNKKWWKKNGYGNYLQTLMEKFKVRDKINFTGLLSEEQMCRKYLNSNVFVCPSAIENSPNSVGEAQLLGVPVVGSYVGGTMDMIEDEETGILYRFEEFEMLARAVCEIFQNANFAKQLSIKSQKVSRLRHDPESNSDKLNTIYERICKG